MEKMTRKENVKRALLELSELIEIALAMIYGKKRGFALLVFDFGEQNKHQTVGYVSNAIRSDMINALREGADTIEADAAGREFVPPGTTMH